MSGDSKNRKSLRCATKCIKEQKQTDQSELSDFAFFKPKAKE